MKVFPLIDDTGKGRENLTSFGGYNHNFRCEEGEFYEMENMTSLYYPILSPRQPRGLCATLEKPQGLIDKDALMWVDNGKLYANGELKTLSVSLTNEGEKRLVKMGAYLVILPDKVWYNTKTGESGRMEAYATSNSSTFTPTDARGVAITARDESYYKTHTPAANDYCIATVNGKSVLKQWSVTSSVWVTVTTTYVQITATGIGREFKAGDGVKLYVASTSGWTDGANLFVNAESDGRRSLSAVITDRTDDSITFAGLIGTTKTYTGKFEIERNVPNMDYMTECNNRLWGCSTDGREIYCCKLGDVTNWNVFSGISTDAWAVTIGSDGFFTGATTYQGNPIFFKEDSMIKISVSSTGAHQVKETYCRGVQRGCDKSLCILNEILYYKSDTGICCYAGSVPYSISDVFADEKYTEAVSGVLGDRYFVSMVDSEGNDHLFVYDASKGKWVREDSTGAMWFAKHNDDLYFIDEKDNVLKSVNGTLLFPTATKEHEIKWKAVSGAIGYTSPDKQYISRMSIKLNLEYGSQVGFYIQYDDGTWEHIFNMAGKGTRTFTLPFKPRRCDHFRWMLKGNGACKVLAMTKTMENGSDM